MKPVLQVTHSKITRSYQTMLFCVLLKCLDNFAKCIVSNGMLFEHLH